MRRSSFGDKTMILRVEQVANCSSMPPPYAAPASLSYLPLNSDRLEWQRAERKGVG
jgi:hypothetical protein